MSRIPVGLQMYTVRDVCEQDFVGALRQVADMGYEGAYCERSSILRWSESPIPVNGHPEVPTLWVQSANEELHA